MLLGGTHHDPEERMDVPKKENGVQRDQMFAVTDDTWPRTTVDVPRRGGLWRTMTRQVRAALGGDSTAGRDGAVLLRWLPLVTFLILQGGVAVYWAGRQSAIVEQHSKVLDVANLSDLKAKYEAQEKELRALRESYDQQEDLIQSLLFYESALQKTIIEKTDLRASDLPRPPLRRKSRRDEE